MIEGVRGESEINQVLESLDVSLSNAFAPAQAAELLTGLHAHYKVRLCVICGYTSVFPGYMCELYVGKRVCFVSLLLCISFSPVLLGLADCTRFLSHAAGSMYQCRSLQASGWDGEAKVWKDASGNSRHGVILGADWWQDDNSVVYGDHEYRTLAGKPPDSLPGGHTDYLVLPPGWGVALNDDNTREVVRRYPWGSRFLAFSGGAASTARSSGDSHFDNTAAVEQSGSAYRCNRWWVCDVLISRSRAYTNARQCTINASESSGHGASAQINSISG